MYWSEAVTPIVLPSFLSLLEGGRSQVFLATEVVILSHPRSITGILKTASYRSRLALEIGDESAFPPATGDEA